MSEAAPETVRDVEDRPAVRAVAGVLLALLGADALAWAGDELPGGRLAGVTLLALPAGAAAERLLRARLADGRVRALAAALLGGLAAALAAAWWASVAPGESRGVPWVEEQVPNALDDLWQALVAGPAPAALLGVTVVAAVVAGPFLVARTRGGGGGDALVSGALGGVAAAGPVALGCDAGGGVLLVAGGALAGLLAGGGAALVARAPAGGAALLWSRGGAGLVAGGLALALGWSGVLHALGGPSPGPRPPDPRPALEACVEALEAYRADQGRYPASLGEAPGVDPGLARGLLEGYLVRYAAFERGAGWGVAVDPHPPYSGLQAYRAGPEGVREADLGAPLETRRE